MDEIPVDAARAEPTTRAPWTELFPFALFLIAVVATIVTVAIT